MRISVLLFLCSCIHGRTSLLAELLQRLHEKGLAGGGQRVRIPLVGQALEIRLGHIGKIAAAVADQHGGRAAAGVPAEQLVRRIDQLQAAQAEDGQQFMAGEILRMQSQFNVHLAADRNGLFFAFAETSREERLCSCSASLAKRAAMACMDG